MSTSRGWTSAAGRPSLLLNDGRATFVDATAGRFPSDFDACTGIALFDADGDGDLDVAFANRLTQNRLYLNDGNGLFTDVTATRMPADGDDSSTVIAADVDGDGDLDLVIANDRQRNRLYINDGAGIFTDGTDDRLPANLDDITWDVAMGGVEGDGDVDIVFANADQNRLYINDGAGFFTDGTATRLPVHFAGTTSVQLTDIDGDGDVDLYCANSWWSRNPENQDRLYVNDGTGTFVDVTAQRLPVDSDDAIDSAAFDADGDGDMDLLIGNQRVRNRLYLNDGTGTFVDVSAANLPLEPFNLAMLSLAVGDVDADGDADIVFGIRGQNQLYINDGAGTFMDFTAGALPADGDAYAVALGDLDSDGDLDAVFGNDFVRNRVNVNLLRQLDVPWVATRGGRYRLDFAALFGPPRGDDLAVPLLSAAPAHIPLPGLGVLAIDPTVAVALPAVVIPRSVGTASLTLNVPRNASIVGTPILAQALWLPGGAEPRLTNATVDVIAR